MHDYRGQSVVPENEIAARLHALVQDFRAAEQQVSLLEAELKQAEAAVRTLRETLIPELMQQLGTDIYRLPQDGTVIEITDDVKAAITVDNREAAYEWLESNGHGGLIKRTIVVAFNRDQEEAAKKLREQLEKQYAGVKQDVSVHGQTLTAWARRRRQAGEEIPECIDVHALHVAKIKAKKEA